MTTYHDPGTGRVPGMSAKEEILARLRSALAVEREDAVTEAEDVPRQYLRADAADPAREKILDLFEKTVTEYRADLIRTGPAELPRVIADLLGEERRLVVPGGVPESWTGRYDGEIVVDDGLTPHQLDEIDAVLTGALLGIAATGTVVLDGSPRCGRRVITLVPDHHIVVVDADDVVSTVPRAIRELGADPSRAITMISGPSATSDIQLERVEGVHGPRRLDVVLLE